MLNKHQILRRIIWVWLLVNVPFTERKEHIGGVVLSFHNLTIKEK